MERINKRDKSWKVFVFSAVLIAMSFVLTRFFSINIGTSIRIGFGRFPVMLAGIYYGPFVGFLVGGIADFLGAILFTGWTPPLTVPAALAGLLPYLFMKLFRVGKGGLGEKKSMKYLPGIMLTAIFTKVLTQGILMTFLLAIIYQMFPAIKMLLVTRNIITVSEALLEGAAIYVLYTNKAVYKLACGGINQKSSFFPMADAGRFDYVSFLNSAERVFTKPGLSRIKFMLASVGNPQEKLKCVHVAGTNGKGSCSNMIASTLTDAGIKTGLYMSPDVSKPFEGLSINGKLINESRLESLVSRVAPSAKKLGRNGDAPTSFEIMTACALLWFSEQNCEVCVVECGMGGELDATNVFDEPLLCVITDIGIDHKKYLGETIEKIASNKAGIIKNNANVLYTGNSEQALKLIKDVCRKRSCTLTVPDYDEAKTLDVSVRETVFDYKSYKSLKLSMPGLAQVRNACLAIEAAEVLNRNGFEISKEAIASGLEKVKLPARFNVFSEKPAVVYDGAHNIDSVKALTENLKLYFEGRKAAAVIGVMADKDYKEILSMLKPFVSMVYTVTPDNKRALPNETLRDEAEKLGIDAKAVEIEKIYDIIKEADKDDLILITGSLYLYKDALPYIEKAVKEKE